MLFNRRRGFNNYDLGHPRWIDSGAEPVCFEVCPSEAWQVGELSYARLVCCRHASHCGFCSLELTDSPVLDQRRLTIISQSVSIFRELSSRVFVRLLDARCQGELRPRAKIAVDRPRLGYCRAKRVSRAGPHDDAYCKELCAPRILLRATPGRVCGTGP